MASQGEREPGVVGMDEGVLESMAQDGDPEQEMLVVEEQELPQLNPELEMCAAAAAAYDTSPCLLRNPPPMPAETAHPRAPDIAQLFAMLARMRGETQQMKEEINNNMDGIKTKTKRMENKLDE